MAKDMEQQGWCWSHGGPKMWCDHQNYRSKLLTSSWGQNSGVRPIQCPICWVMGYHCRLQCQLFLRRSLRQVTIDNAICQLTTSQKKTGTVRKENEFNLILEKIGKLTAKGKQLEERQVFAVKRCYHLKGCSPVLAVSWQLNKIRKPKQIFGNAGILMLLLLFDITSRLKKQHDVCFLGSNH